METLFFRLLNMSINAGWLVLAVLLLRAVLRGAPRWLMCALWGLVGLRLVLPFSIESVFSLIPSAETVSPDIVYAREPAIDSGVSVINKVVNPIVAQSFTPDPATSANPLQIWVVIASFVWIVGAVLMVGYMIAGYLRLCFRLRTATKIEEKVYAADAVDSPFILGIFRPRIYIPYGFDEEAYRYVYEHEMAHLARKDHFIKPLAFVILAVYWFNPLMWVAYVMLCRDIEYACDEKVMRDWDKEARRLYAKTMLACSIEPRSIRACPLAFGEVSVKSRIKKVMNYKKPTFWLILLAVIAIIVTSVCFLTNPIRETPALRLLSVTTTSGEENVSVFISEQEVQGSDLHMTLMWDYPMFAVITRQAVLYHLCDGTYTLYETVSLPNAEVSTKTTMSHKITMEGLEAGNYRLELIYEIPSQMDNRASIFIYFTLGENNDFPPMYYVAEKIMERDGTHYSDPAYIPYFYIDENMNLYEKRQHYMTGSVLEGWMLCGALKKLEQTLPNVEVWEISCVDEFGNLSRKTFSFYEDGKVVYAYADGKGGSCLVRMRAVADMTKQLNVISVESLIEDVGISHFGTEIAYQNMKLVLFLQNNTGYCLSHQGHEYDVDGNGEHVVRIVDDVRLEKQTSDGWEDVEYFSTAGWGMASGGGISAYFNFGITHTPDRKAFEEGVYRLTFSVDLLSELVDFSSEGYDEQCVERNVPCAEVIFEGN